MMIRQLFELHLFLEEVSPTDTVYVAYDHKIDGFLFTVNRKGIHQSRVRHNTTHYRNHLADEYGLFLSRWDSDTLEFMRENINSEVVKYGHIDRIRGDRLRLWIDLLKAETL